MTEPRDGVERGGARLLSQGPLEDQLWQLGLEIAEARCCRSWPVIRGVRIGKCGYCGEVPRIVGDWATRETA